MSKTLAHGYMRLKPADGASRQGQHLTVENVEKFHASPDAVQQVAAALKEMGFAVRGQGPLGISFAGRPDLFMGTFGARLVEKAYHPLAPKIATAGERPLAPAKEKLVARYFVGEKRLVVPQALRRSVENVRLAPPVRWFSTPDAPAIPYYHLDVPEGVRRLMDAHAAHDHGINGAGVRICVIDTGFHPHEWYPAHGFAVNLVGAGADVDDYGHGTAIITNAMSVAPGAQFFGVKLADAAGALQSARTVNPHVISCSWGLWFYDQDVHDEIVDAVAHNITVCFAAGNQGMVCWPGAMPEVLCVGGAYMEDSGATQASSYASSGTDPNEPGRQVPDVCGLVGLTPHGLYIAMPTQDGSTCDDEFSGFGDMTAADDGWLVASGTSSACPQVAGAAALVLQQSPGLTPAQVKAALRQCCRDVAAGASANGEAAGPGVDNATGWGLVDAFTAVHPVDVWCKDVAGDTGCVPGTSIGYSPDIWLRPAADGGPDIGMNPEHGQANWVYVRARNRGTQAAANVLVHAYWADFSTGIAWPVDWKTDGFKVGGVPGNTQTIANIPAAGEVVAGAFEWWPPDPLTADDHAGNFCLLVRVECPDDPITHEGSIGGDNNIAMRNVHVVDLLPDMAFTFRVGVSAMPNLGGKPTLTMKRVRGPEGLRVDLGPAALAVEPLNFAGGARQKVAVTLRPPKDARVGDICEVAVIEEIGGVPVGAVWLIARVVDKANLVGDRGALVVHKWGCPDIAAIKADNKLLINTMNAARAMRFKPCARCRPT